MNKIKQKIYNQEYYKKNKAKILKDNAEYQRSPVNIEKRKARTRERYRTNDKGFRDKNLKSHDKLKQNPKWVKRKRAVISLWGIKNRGKETDRERAREYYKKNKAKILKHKKESHPSKVSMVLQRVKNNRFSSNAIVKQDIRILKNEIKRIKTKWD